MKCYRHAIVVCKMSETPRDPQLPEPLLATLDKLFRPKSSTCMQLMASLSAEYRSSGHTHQEAGCAVAVLSLGVVVLMGHVVWLCSRMRRKRADLAALHSSTDTQVNAAVEKALSAALCGGPIAHIADSSYHPSGHYESTAAGASGIASPAAASRGARVRLPKAGRARNTKGGVGGFAGGPRSEKDSSRVLDSMSCIDTASTVSVSMPTPATSPANHGRCGTGAGAKGKIGLHCSSCCASGRCQCKECTCGRICSRACRQERTAARNTHACKARVGVSEVHACLLYTSDAADE